MRWPTLTREARERLPAGVVNYLLPAAQAYDRIRNDRNRPAP